MKSGIGEADAARRYLSTHRLEGTAVYDGCGCLLGSIFTILIDRRSGQVAFAVVVCGSVGLDQRYYVLPWEALHEDARAGSYLVHADRVALEAVSEWLPNEACAGC
jgi:hypothetical protein